MNYEWKKNRFTVHLSEGEYDRKRQRQALCYKLFDGDKLIFTGCDFYPPPPCDPYSEDVVMALLDFLTLQPGDTDEEYFEDYTPEQLGWCQSERAEELRMIMIDYHEE